MPRSEWSRCAIWGSVILLELVEVSEVASTEEEGVVDRMTPPDVTEIFLA